MLESCTYATNAGGYFVQVRGYLADGDHVYDTIARVSLWPDGCWHVGIPTDRPLYRVRHIHASKRWGQPPLASDAVKARLLQQIEQLIDGGHVVQAEPHADFWVARGLVSPVVQIEVKNEGTLQAQTVARPKRPAPSRGRITVENQMCEIVTSAGRNCPHHAQAGGQICKLHTYLIAKGAKVKMPVTEPGTEFVSRMTTDAVASEPVPAVVEPVAATKKAKRVKKERASKKAN